MKKIAFFMNFYKLAGTETSAMQTLEILAKKYEIDIYHTNYYHFDFKPYLSQETLSQIKNEFDHTHFDQVLLIERKKDAIKSKINRLRFPIIQKKIDLLNSDYYDCIIAFEDRGARYLKLIEHKNKICWNHFNYSEWEKQNKGEINFSDVIKDYSSCSKVISVSKIGSQKMKSIFNEHNVSNIETDFVHNTVNSAQIILKSKEEMVNYNTDLKTFILPARVEKNQKDTWRVIEISNKLYKNGFKHKLIILGELELIDQKHEFEDFLSENNQEEHIKWLGHVSNPFPYILAANWMLLLSHFEGYPMSILEALCLNVPVLATNTGSSEVIEDKFGYIVEDDFDAIYEMWKMICEDKIKPKQFSLEDVNKKMDLDREKIYEVICGK